MARSSVRPQLVLALVCAPALALVAAGVARGHAPVSESQILTIGADSLTTYLVTSKTNVQDVRPRAEQRGVGVDGGLRAEAPFGMAIGGNPFGVAWNGSKRPAAS